MSMRTKLFPVVGKSALCRNCPDCGTLFKHKNTIDGFPNHCYCEKCKNIRPIKLVKKKEEVD